MISGQSSAFHASMNAKSATVASAGRASGSATRVKTCHSDAPSSRAASSMSRGSDRKYCRMRKIPQAATSSIDTRPATVSTSPIASTMRKRGTSSAMPGIISVPR